MIISVDTGNKHIKTENFVFQAGLHEMDSLPPDLNTKVLEYRGKYYVPSNKRIAYMKDKTLDERYFILTLLGTAMELEKKIEKGFYHLIPNRQVSIELLVGLPPADYTGLYEKFEQYFLRSGEPIAFRYGNRAYLIHYHEVVSYIQAYAAAVMYSKDYNLLVLHKALIIDIGGFTLDYMVLRYGEPDTNGFDTLERGGIPMYNSIVHRVRNQFDILLEEADIDMIIMDKDTVFSEDVRVLVGSVVEEYVVNTLGIFREIGIDFNTLTTIFVGGGSMLLKGMIEKVWGRYSGKYFVVEDPTANAKGYKKLYMAEHSL